MLFHPNSHTIRQGTHRKAWTLHDAKANKSLQKVTQLDDGIAVRNRPPPKTITTATYSVCTVYTAHAHTS